MSWSRTWSLQAEVEGIQLENFKGKHISCLFFCKRRESLSTSTLLELTADSSFSPAPSCVSDLLEASLFGLDGSKRKYEIKGK